MRPWSCALVCVMLGWIYPAHAYEAHTHNEMSRHAFERSIVRSYLQEELRIEDVHEFQSLTIGGAQSAIDFVRNGAVAEDDYVSLALGRPRNHFYNPLTGDAYTHLPIPGLTNYPAPSWALEDNGDISSQAYSFKDARAYFYNALTKTQRFEREDQFANAFYALGHVIHLVQDMAQPQHTRDDSHLGATLFAVVASYAAHKGLYEQYTEDNFVPLPYETPQYPVVYRMEDVPGYPRDTTTFKTSRSFFHTSGDLGIADYSNRDFVSAGTNFTSANGGLPTIYPQDILATPGFPSPNGNGALIQTEQIQNLPGHAPNLSGAIDFIETYVHDFVRGPGDWNNRTSTYSIFDSDLQAKGKKLTFTLNRYNFEAAWPFLIPRAVGYSAGLINYFFRGKIDFAPDPDNDHQYLIKNLGPEDMNGTFALYYDDANGDRHPVPGNSAWSRPILAGGQVSVQAFGPTFTPPPSGTFTLVFHGTMGNETHAVAAKVVGSSFLLLSVSIPWICPSTCPAPAPWSTVCCDPSQPWATYQSTLVDRNWQRVNSGTMPASWGGGISFGAAYVGGGLGFLSDGGGVLRIENSVHRVGWGQNFEFYPQALTYLGGSDLLATGIAYSSGGAVAYSADLGVTFVERPVFFQGLVLTYVGSGATLLFGSTNGDTYSVYRSTDKGQTWDDLQPTFDGTPLDSGSFPMAMAWNHVAGSGSVILAVTWTPVPGAYFRRQLWKSTDGGVSWVSVAYPAPSAPWWGPTSLAISPSNEVLLLMEVEGSEWWLYRSLDAGQTWQRATTPWSSAPGGSCDATYCVRPIIMYWGNNNLGQP